MINISLLSLSPFAVQQTLNNNVNNGSAMFTIGMHTPGDYQFYIQVSSGQGDCGQTNWYTYGPTFEIKASVPVSFDLFKGVNGDNKTDLFWSTHAEINNLGFEIQQGRDIKNWESLGYVEGSGNTNELTHYSYSHINPENGNHFYRLKQIDFNGAYVYSDIINIRAQKDEVEKVTLYPNPCNDVLNVFTSEEKTNFIILSSSGKTIFQGVTNNNKIDVTHLNPGMYFLKTPTSTASTTFIKL